MTVQTLIFSGMSVASAKAWAKRHGFRYGKVDVTSASVRLRQRDPREFAPNSFRTIPLRDGVQAVVGRPVVTRAGRSGALRANPERTHNVPELLMAVQDLVLWARGIGPATSRTRYYLRAAGYPKGGDRAFWLGEALDEVKRDAQHDPRVASHVAYMLKEYPGARVNPDPERARLLEPLFGAGRKLVRAVNRGAGPDVEGALLARARAAAREADAHGLPGSRILRAMLKEMKSRQTGFWRNPIAVPVGQGLIINSPKRR